MSPICGPPPCTTTGLMAVCSSSTMSRAKLARRCLVAHGVAAVFHHDDFLVVALHVGQRFGEDAGDVVLGYAHEDHFGSDLARSGCGLGRGSITAWVADEDAAF